MENNLLLIRGLFKAYDGQPAVQGMDLEVRGGEIVGLVGPNGAGKTTTIKIVVGLLRADFGYVNVRGMDIFADPVTYKKWLGYMPETPTLPEYLTAEEFLGYVAKLRLIPRESAQKKIIELLRTFDLELKRRELIVSLSKGMKAKLAFAASVIHDPELLILDEPLIGIDPAGQHQIKDMLRKMADKGKGVLVSTHMLDTAERLCDRVAIVNHGRNVASGDLKHLQSLVKRGEGATLEEIFLKLTEEAKQPMLEEPSKKRSLFAFTRGRP